MDLNDYQNEAMKTAAYDKKWKIYYPCLGLVGEAGECAEKVKKLIRDKNCKLDVKTRGGLIKEMGDVLWYLSSLANDLGVDLNTVARTNLEKLRSRAQDNKIHGDGDDR